ncbi:transcriptional regulator, DeoR family [Gemmobacter megaterium]|uniref:Transcriptional regulator, DeoR family n=1 Tax=Gemmobacter megaterium TaxID=1086013 RepID=A0A1N7N8Y7_9RHOB|nr:DeoR/GlpR family DNA-binding transcription regulator [Gemmobacter megaterium]GGE13650.1 DeoR family transcriptional regulator [Gemmobacter megaterium]SIS94800.1 transcriptional regulator, DeoR family [Gemmobacter megaterium]
MQPNHRREQILRLLRDHGRQTVDSLARAMGTSEATIRRDLVDLEDANRLRRFHGGARLICPAPADAPGEDAFGTRLLHNRAGKQALTQAAAALFEDGASLFIDAGTTTIAFAHALAARRDLTVITNSLEVARILGEDPDRHRIHLLGGELLPEMMELVGRMTLQQIGGYRADHVVLTVGSVQESGVLDFDEREAEVAIAMIARARRLTVLADRTKMLKPAVFPVASLAQITRLVTDAPPPPGIARALAQAGAELVLAPATDAPAPDDRA